LLFYKREKRVKRKEGKKKGEKKIENLPLSLFFLRGGIASHKKQFIAENIGVRNRAKKKRLKEVFFLIDSQ
jgi:hypothetical protein